ncbi:hypothetical protein [Azospirillum thermophilum]|uniref:hypothetical protein n=1 Tax=Azospirillum thermophilum TaxID=2202148 RepID=UPI0011B35FDC|nr:hypothetical protein [Azospirillum thermophilum]
MDLAEDASLVLLAEPAESGTGWLLRHRLLTRPGWQVLHDDPAGGYAAFRRVGLGGVCRFIFSRSC